MPVNDFISFANAGNSNLTTRAAICGTPHFMWNLHVQAPKCFYRLRHDVVDSVIPPNLRLRISLRSGKFETRWTVWQRTRGCGWLCCCWSVLLGRRRSPWDTIRLGCRRCGRHGRCERGRLIWQYWCSDALMRDACIVTYWCNYWKRCLFVCIWACIGLYLGLY